MAEILLGNIRGKDGRGLDIKGVAENFASLAEFIELLKEWRSTLHVPRTPEAWSEFTLLWINNFFSGTSKEYLPEVNELKRAAGRIAANAAAAARLRLSVGRSGLEQVRVMDSAPAVCAPSEQR